MPKTSTIVLAGKTISITRDPIASNTPDLIAKENIISINGIFNQKPNNGDIAHGVVVGAYTVGETITGGTSGATATLLGFKSGTAFYLKNISLATSFVSGETLTGGSSGATSTSSSVVTPTSYAGEWIYPYPTQTLLIFALKGDTDVSIELQEVSNQPTWSTGTRAALNTAVAAIDAFL